MRRRVPPGDGSQLTTTADNFFPNADKAAIADLDLRRLKRLTDHARATP